MKKLIITLLFLPLLFVVPMETQAWYDDPMDMLMQNQRQQQMERQTRAMERQAREMERQRREMERQRREMQRQTDILRQQQNSW